MDKFKIDSHKLMFHVERVNQWKRGENIYPVYMEVSPSGGCNHRCTYCGLDFMEYQPRFLDAGIFQDRLKEMGRLGLRSIMYAGEGEPFLHKDMARIIADTKKNGIDVAVTTNGTLMKKDISEKILPQTTWIKVSMNGATKETYAKIHRCRPEDYDRVVENMKFAARLKKEKSYRCTLGIQLLLLPENHHETVALAKLARDIGMDYLVVKPYSQHPQSKTTVYSFVKYSEYEFLRDELAAFNTASFQVIFRINTMKKWDEGQKTYDRCLALPFWSYIDAGGNVWGCSVYLEDERFFYGNIYQQTFREIWEGARRKESLAWVREKMDVSKCRINCRMDEINRYLWELRHPSDHVNFI